MGESFPNRLIQTPLTTKLEAGLDPETLRSQSQWKPRIGLSTDCTTEVALPAFLYTTYYLCKSYFTCLLYLQTREIRIGDSDIIPVFKFFKSVIFWV